VLAGLRMIGNEDDRVVVIRFWQERDPNVVRSNWRARITYVNSGVQFYASGIDEAFTLVRSLLLSAQPKEGGAS